MEVVDLFRGEIGGYQADVELGVVDDAIDFAFQLVDVLNQKAQPLVGIRRSDEIGLLVIRFIKDGDIGFVVL